MLQTQKLESLGVLAGGIAHDFNNLLVGIIGNVSLAVETMTPNKAAERMLLDAIAASETAAHLTKQLLAYAGKGRFVLEVVDLSAVVQEIKTLIQSSIPKAVQLRLDLQNGLPPIEADLSQVKQLIMNLIINAAEAIPEDQGGTVLVTTRVQEVDEGYVRTVLAPVQLQPGTYITLEVHDTGIGMTNEVIARIFDPFFSTKFTGRGLGLAAVLGIVQGHKGALKVYSTPGRGTTFKVLFPAASVGAQPPTPRPPKAPRHGSAMVLVIDDEVVVRRTAKSMLERFGYTVMSAEDGKQGVELFRALADKVSVVLLDMTMPVMSGEETFRELRAIKPNVRVVLSSGYNEVEAVRRFTGKGLAGFLQKPYSATTLAEKVQSVIEESEQHTKDAQP
jgi:CheY-like chemotaxis protein